MSEEILKRPWSRWVAVVILTALLLGGVRLLAHFPSGHQPEEGAIRLAWRIAGEKVRLCRKASREEQAAIPQHMRLPEQCQEHLLSYDLQVVINGQERYAAQYAPAGAKGDRPIFVHEEIKLKPGEYDLAVHFMPAIGLVDWQSRFGELTEDEQGQLKQSLAGTARMNYQGRVRVRAGRIVLLDLDEGIRQFFIRGG